MVAEMLIAGALVVGVWIGREQEASKQKSLNITIIKKEKNETNN